MMRCRVEEEEAAAASARLVGLGVDRGERDAGADAEHRDCDGEARLVEPQEDREEKDPDGNLAGGLRCVEDGRAASRGGPARAAAPSSSRSCRR